MMDKILGELEGFDLARAVDFREARKSIQGRGGPVSIEVLRRWANPKKGYRASVDGQVIVFPAVKLTGEWWTMPSWIEAFERARVNLGRGAAGRPPATAAPKTRTPRQREAACRRAERELDRLQVHAPAMPMD